MPVTPERPAVEGLEDPREFVLRDSWAAIDDADLEFSGDDARADRDPLGARVAGGVLEQVREGPLELRAVGPDEREVGVHGEAEARVRRVELIGRLSQDLLD